MLIKDSCCVFKVDEESCLEGLPLSEAPSENDG